jgi:phosphoglycolate phosphatase-like HAD superfamily hydrolase
MLEALKRRGYRLAILSDKRRAFGEEELRWSGLERFFELAIFRDGEWTFKPEPDGLLLVLRRLLTPGQRAIYIGDSIVDVLAARRAGVKAGAALWGSLDRESVLRERPDYAWERTEELLRDLAPAG